MFSVDTAADPLWRRGYRLDSAKVRAAPSFRSVSQSSSSPYLPLLGTRVLPASRGWRQAPLREDIAHSLLLAAGLPNALNRLAHGKGDGGDECPSSQFGVLDPLCGSGTIAIEVRV